MARMAWMTRSGKERPWNLRRDGAMRLALLALILAMTSQFAFWNFSRTVMPDMGVVPNVPSEQTVRALAFGDEEAFFRLLGLRLQNSGDTFGRSTPLYQYDYNTLYHWFHLLDGLNPHSHYMPALAAYYFSQSQNPKNLVYILDYLDEHTQGHEKEQWWWITQAVYIAMHRLNDPQRALTLALRLRGLRGIPLWAQQMPAFIHEKRGEFGDALRIIEAILQHPEDYSESELNFMTYFISDRLGKMDEIKAQLDAIKARRAQMKASGFQDPEPMAPPSGVGAATLPMGGGE